MRVDTFVRDGLTFDVRDRGPLDGQAVVLLHGWPQDATAFDEVAALLDAAGLRTLAPDQRGYSPGARPRGRAAYRLGECVADVVALLDAAGLSRAHVVGHDWGGAVAWSLATHHPDRVASLVVLSTPHPAALAWAFTHSSQAVRSWYMALFQVPCLAERLVGPRLERVLRDGGLPPRRAAHYAARMREPGALSASLAWYRAMTLRRPGAGGGARAGADGPSRSTSTARVGVPTTYVWGEHDVALGRAAALRTIDFVAGDYLFVALVGPDAGHWLPETHPAQVAAAVCERVTIVPK